MGLSVYAYSEVKKSEMNLDDFYQKDPAKHMTLFIHPHFPDHAKDFQDATVYSWEEVFSFDSGYSRHLVFRDNLAKMAGYAPSESASGFKYFATAIKTESGPFWHLINFADNEGVIGTEVSKILYEDFAKFENQAANFGDLDFLARYSRWKTAFAFSSKNGCVDFR